MSARKKPAKKTRRASPYATGLDPRQANYVPLTPLSFLARSAAVYPDKPAVIHPDDLARAGPPRAGAQVGVARVGAPPGPGVRAPPPGGCGG